MAKEYQGVIDFIYPKYLAVVNKKSGDSSHIEHDDTSGITHSYWNSLDEQLGG
jgi:hypothetical protein